MAARAGRQAARALAGALVLGVSLWWAGVGAVDRALAAVDLRTAGVAVGCTAVATVASAWRWRLLAERAGLELGLGEAVRAYYRSQLLNATLPFGIVGDVDRAVRHGHSAARPRLAGCTVVADRVLGQCVALLLTGVGLATVPTLLPGWLEPVSRWVAVACLLALLVLLARAPLVVLASLVVVGAHASTFVVAARAVGVQAPVGMLATLALVVLAGGSLPLNVAGWGPREGVAAWAFAAVGLGAGAGVAAAVVHGVATLVAVSPGLLPLPARFAPPVPAGGPTTNPGPPYAGRAGLAHG